MGKAQTQPVYPRGLDFEQVWAALMETEKIVKENAERLRETEKIVRENAERQRETDRQMKETDRQMKETDRQIKEFNKRFGEFTNRFGEVVEHLIAPNLLEKFRELGLNFLQANKNTDIIDRNNGILFEIDVLLQNGDRAMLVEIKNKLTTEDVKEHMERLEKMRAYANLHGDKRSFLGAVAGVVMTSNVKEFALGQGFYVIEPSGETFNITPPNGSPKEW